MARVRAAFNQWLLGLSRRQIWMLAACGVGIVGFALVLPDTDNPGAQHVISTLTRQIQEAFTDGRAPVTCSIGVVTFFDPPVSARSILAAADTLMYEVKRSGKSAIAFKVLGEVGQSLAAAGRTNTARG